MPEVDNFTFLDHLAVEIDQHLTKATSEKKRKFKTVKLIGTNFSINHSLTAPSGVLSRIIH